MADTKQGRAANVRPQLSPEFIEAQISLADSRDADGPMQDRALEVVRAFIVERGLVIYGGLAIDYALRLKGGHIYPDNERPDFDFFSPNHVEDAYDLADRLAKLGFADVGAIRAIHVQTMRVKTDFCFVADISYMPMEIFKNLPYLQYPAHAAAPGSKEQVKTQGLRVIHPDFQRMDMHLSLSFPFDGPPRENVFNRWKKDVKRFNLLAEAYPIDPQGLAAAKIGGGGVPRASAPLPTQTAPARYALHGFAAYAALRVAFADLQKAAAIPGAKTGGAAAASPTETSAGAKTAGAASPTKTAVDVKTAGAASPTKTAVDVKTAGAESGINIKISEADVPISIKGGLVTFEAPGYWPQLVVAATDFDAIIDGHDCARYSALMDCRPEMAVLETKPNPTHVYDIRDRLLSTSVIEIAPNVSVTVVCVQMLLLYFMTEAQYAVSTAARTTAAMYYVSTIKMIQDAMKLTIEMAKTMPTDVREKFVNSSPFGLSVRSIGTVNQDPAFRIRIAQTVLEAERTGGDPPASLHLGTLASLKAGLEGLPTNYHPGRGVRRGPFDYSGRHFQRSGALLVPPKKEIGDTPANDMKTAPTNQ